MVRPLHAQAIRPVIAEYNEKARGRFDLVNDSLIPLNVVLETKSFSVGEDGSPTFRPLDKSIHLKLSQMSFRIPPQQTYYVFYEATAPHYPAWFVIYASFSGLPQQSGLNVQVELPHTVYMGQKVALTRDEVQLGKAEYLPGLKQVQIEIKNIGDRLGRVSEVEVRGDREKTAYSGFPLMPGSRRRVTVEWKSSVPPQRAIVQFKNFKIETPLQERRN
ncbi:MAG: hypothetical protein HY508_04805 [Acidobacteria bacterium]|nr:hypothetical protein [Acidobacteriota bacterium]